MATVASRPGTVCSILRTNPAHVPPSHWIWLAFQLCVGTWGFCRVPVKRRIGTAVLSRAGFVGAGRPRSSSGRPLLEGRGEGLPLDERGRPVLTNPARDRTAVPMRRFTGTRQKPHVPTQSWNASHIQWDGGTCAGFVRSIEQTVPGRDATVAMT